MLLRSGSLAVAAIALSIVSGCALQPQQEPQVFSVPAMYNSSEMAWSKKDGSATLEGGAVMRTRGGDAKSCAGTKVYLIPYSVYGMQRLSRIYGNDERAFLNVSDFQRRRVIVQPDFPEYRADAREQVCDTLGNFKFDKVPAGKWWIQTQVLWQVGNLNQGGMLLQAVELKDGESKRVILTP